MIDLVVSGGAPGAGKTTVSKVLQRRLTSPRVELGHLRSGHLFEPDWSDESEREVGMAFENLAFIVRNYLRHGYRPVIMLDLTEPVLSQVPDVCGDLAYIIATLIVTDEAVLRARVLDAQRDSGFRNVPAALAWNRRDRQRPMLPGEHRIDNTGADPEHAVARIAEIMDS